MKGYIPKDFFKQLKNEKNDYLKNINTICETWEMKKYSLMEN